ncbi:MAG TPA: bicarbonate-binding protein, partial [Cyanobacteria bacterium UBA11049]|nr:bicarbonate-binding protein [Cyanobacteria bacterium UBA11049]
MSTFSNVSRRRFLITAGASAAGSIFLKGCLGNPPGMTTTSSAGAVNTAAADISPEQMPETSTVKLGYIPIVESAPLVIAKEKGFF